MSQQLPPGGPGGAAHEPDDREQPSFAREERAAGGNPYYVRHQPEPAPDLDAEAPVLRTSDVQRLNRKALVFLAGIVALLGVMTYWLLNRATTGDDRPALQRQQAVVVPELPQENAPPPAMPPPPGADADGPPLPLEPDASDAGAGAAAVHGGGAPAPSLMERRINGLEGDAGGDSTDGYAAGPTQPAATRRDATSAQSVNHPDALLVRGTYLRCVLETRIATDIPGFTSCIITEPVYSITGHNLLLPSGATTRRSTARAWR